MRDKDYPKQIYRWSDYLSQDNEPPATNRKYEISPEELQDLLDYSYFLKRRVLRKAHKVQRQYAKASRDNHKVHKFHLRPHHSF